MRELGRGFLASIGSMLMLGVDVRMGVHGAIAMSVFVFVLNVLVGMGVGDTAGVFMLVSVLLTGLRRRHSIYS